jgi:hypothetical protein
MRLIPSLPLAAAFSMPASAGVIVLEGNYQGKNLFIQNPFSEAGVGFCVFEVTVNDQIATDEINQRVRGGHEQLRPEGRRWWW